MSELWLWAVHPPIPDRRTLQLGPRSFPGSARRCLLLTASDLVPGPVIEPDFQQASSMTKT